MKIFKLEDYKTSQILLLIAVIIIVFPSILILPAISKYFDYSSTGNIGDTIGGVTSPFINGLAAILVFIAFKAQIKANEIFKNQEKSRNILEQITIIQDDRLEIERKIPAVTNRVGLLASPRDTGLLNLINKVVYFISELRLTYELIEEYSGEKDFLYRKLYYLYVIRYKDLITDLEVNLKSSLSSINKDYEGYIAELLLKIEHLNESLKDVNKYKETKNKRRM